jgi:hypothetical protein
VANVSGSLKRQTSSDASTSEFDKRCDDYDCDLQGVILIFKECILKCCELMLDP